MVHVKARCAVVANAQGDAAAVIWRGVVGGSDGSGCCACGVAAVGAVVGEGDADGEGFANVGVTGGVLVFAFVVAPGAVRDFDAIGVPVVVHGVFMVAVVVVNFGGEGRPGFGRSVDGDAGGLVSAVSGVGDVVAGFYVVVAVHEVADAAFIQGVVFHDGIRGALANGQVVFGRGAVVRNMVAGNVGIADATQGDAALVMGEGVVLNMDVINGTVFFGSETEDGEPHAAVIGEGVVADIDVVNVLSRFGLDVDSCLRRGAFKARVGGKVGGAAAAATSVLQGAVLDADVIAIHDGNTLAAVAISGDALNGNVVVAQARVGIGVVDANAVAPEVFDGGAFNADIA